MKAEKTRREELTKFFASQVAMALNYLHSQGIVYGDLKPENILLDKYGYIKLTDFGASKMLNGMQSIMGFAGTPDYLAPEILRNKKITKASDWWTFGILVYEMLYDTSPFFHRNSKVMFKGIITQNVRFPENDFDFSPESQDFITQLLHKNPMNRLGNDREHDIFEHPWFEGLDFSKIKRKQMPSMVIPHIEDEKSVENFDNGITGGELSLSFDEEGEKHHIRKNSLDDPLENFNFEEKGYVETAMLPDEESDSFNFEETSRKQSKSGNQTSETSQLSMEKKAYGLGGKILDELNSKSPQPNRKDSGPIRTSRSMPRMQEELGDILKEIDSDIKL